jgi:hypothetical protein
MRIGPFFLLTVCCTFAALAQGPPTQGESPQKREAQSTEPGRAPQPAPSEASTATQVSAGTMIFLKIVEPAANGDLTEVQFRNSSVSLYEKLTKEFQKEGRFRLVERSSDAQVVFFVLRYWKPNYPHTLTYLALAVSHDDYTKNVQMLNPFRGVAHVEAMLPSAIWGTGKNYNMAKHWTVGLATAGFFNTGRPNPADLVRQFLHDVQ